MPVAGTELTEAIGDLLNATADPEGGRTRLEAVLETRPEIAADPVLLERAATVCGSSRSLGASLALHPTLLEGTPPPGAGVPLQMRAALIPILAGDLTGALDLADATAAWSDAVDGIVQRALTEAREALTDRHPVLGETSFAVIGMGKWGARELNYYSDLDLLFVHEGPDGSADGARTAAVALAAKLMTTLSSPTFDGTAFVVDADLRPEGAVGPLSRSLESHRTYYARWAEAWESQALLKARAVAGDPQLGQAFEEMARDLVWERGLDSDDLRAIRLLKARSEDGASSRDVKRGPGGIRDVEFAVQMLQLVHGRFDEDLRVRSTLEAIEALGAHGYIEPADADSLAAAYRFLRHVEHRLQIWDLSQTHTLPTAPRDKERLGRSLGMLSDSVEEFDRRMAETRAQVRDLHEHLYFRPVLDALAGLATARLDPAAARLRLAALGFIDVAAAEAAFEEMTAGLSRRSRAMQQALPLTLDWLSRSPDPDLGLDQLRLLLANAADHGSVATLLQTNPIAGERLCLLLGTGRLIGALLDRIPEFVPKLAEEEPDFDIRDAEGATERLIGLLDSRPDPDDKVGTVRRFARRRMLRVAARDILDQPPVDVTTGSLADSADAVMRGALRALEVAGGFGVVALGKWGGRELSYGSDLDLIYAHTEDLDRETAFRIAGGIGRVVSEPGRHGPGMTIDTELRPEGRRGPIARSLDGYRRYYAEWAEPWEVMALLRARPAAGDPQLLGEFMDLVSSVVWRPFDDAFVRSIRTVKARVEAERLPIGTDPANHIKLGPGGISDIEFTTHLLQLRHGASEPSLRTPVTGEAIRALAGTGILASDEARALSEALDLLTRLRLRLHLRGGTASDVLPTDSVQLGRLASSLGFDRRTELVEQYRRHTRRARKVFEKRFYE